ncbi:biotin-independent malonate decarboxylase subunit beta, partial [Xanthomonas arboricola pv. corylina]
AAVQALDTLAEPEGEAALQALELAQQQLSARIAAYGDCRDGLEIWQRQGIVEAQRLPLLDTDAFLAATADRSTPWN